MINEAPISVSTLGISPQIKYPSNIAKTKLRYLVGVTRDASAILKDTVNKIFATDPIIPVNTNKNNSNLFGIIHPKGKVNKPTIMLKSEKYKAIL